MVQFPVALGAHTDDLKVRVTHPNKVKWTRVAANKELLATELGPIGSNSKLDIWRLKVINLTAQFTALICIGNCVIKSVKVGTKRKHLTGKLCERENRCRHLITLFNA
jgi:hypothetical protein